MNVSYLKELRKFEFEDVGPQHFDNYDTLSSNNIKKEIITTEFENEAEEGGENRGFVVDNSHSKDDIEIHDLKYFADDEQIKTETVSSDVQLRNNGLAMNNNFKIVDSKLKFEVLDVEPKTETDTYVLKEEEISINDEMDADDSTAFNEYSERDCSSASELKVPVKINKNSKFASSFVRESVPEMEQKGSGTTKKSIEQLRALTNNAYQLIKINDGYRCGLCPFQNQLEEEVKVHLENYHYSTYARLILDKVVHEKNSDKLDKQFGVVLSKCLYCDYEANRKEDLKNHLEKHFPKTKNNYLRERVQKDSDEFLLHKCELCDYKTKRKYSLKMHSIRHSDESTFYECEHCDFKTKRKKSLRLHLIGHSDDSEVYICEHCDYKTKHKSILKKHSIVHSDECELYKCEHCSFKTKYKYNLKVHSITHSVEGNFYECEYCNFKTKYKSTLQTHLKVHSGESKLYTCEHCDYKSIYKQNLKTHLIGHSDESKFYQCEHCDYKTKLKFSLKRHLIRHSDGSNFYKCLHCDFKVKHKNSLKTHLRVHFDKNKLFICEHCDYKTIYKQNLKTHLLGHSGDPTFYQCEHCDYKTINKYRLKEHLIRHSDESNFYKCEHCYFKTKRKINLKIHLKVHCVKSVNAKIISKHIW